MRSFAFLARHRLLLCIFLLSLSLHLLAVAWIDPWPPLPAAPLEARPLALRLAPPMSAARQDAAPIAALSPAPPAPSPPAPSPRPASTAAADTGTASSRPARPADESTPAAPAEATEAAEPAIAWSVLPTHGPADDAGAVSNDGAGVDLPVQLPGQYRASPSGSVRIDYRVVTTAPEAAPRAEGTAFLEWRSDGSSYELELDGVLGDVASEGGLDDTGIAPRRVRERIGAGHVTTVFDRQQGRIVPGIGGRSAQLLSGSQDAASVLLQLGGMGNTDHVQLRSTVSILVGGMDGARAERFEMVAEERVDTGIGVLETMRLARLAAPGAPLLEIWLAPAQAWLPVQLRMTAPDGTARTQTLSAIAFAAPRE